MSRAVRTKANTPFERWYRLSIAAFDKFGLSAPSREDALGAYELGESPETWAAYVANA